MCKKEVKVTLVSLKQPCTACLITCNLLREMLDKICREYSFVAIEDIELYNLKEIHSINGLEVEKLPALLINNEQITAGSLPMKNQLISIIKSEAEL